MNENTTTAPPEKFRYSGQRGGWAWIIENVQYVNGDYGLVNRQYDDGQWRICRSSPGLEGRDNVQTYRTRDDAARAEWERTREPATVRADIAKCREFLATFDRSNEAAERVVHGFEFKIARGLAILAETGEPEILPDEDDETTDAMDQGEHIGLSAPGDSELTISCECGAVVAGATQAETVIMWEAHCREDDDTPFAREFAVLLSSTSRDVYPELVCSTRHSTRLAAWFELETITRAQPGIRATVMRRTTAGAWLEEDTRRTAAEIMARFPAAEGREAEGRAAEGRAAATGTEAGQRPARQRSEKVQ